MIHVCFGLHDKNGRYSKFTGTTIYSIFANTDSEVTVHILHDNTLTLDNREKFIYLAGRYGQTIKFYNVEELCAEKLQKLNSLSGHFNDVYSPAANYRFLIAQILPSDIDKVIYEDADIIVNLDIEELWRINLAGRPLAAVPVHLQNASKKKGIERAKKMNLMNIELEVIADNKAAIALYHKMGFSDVGIIKKYWFANNAYSDAIVMQKCLDE